jgi:outer membrane lipoprotein SlyB
MKALIPLLAVAALGGCVVAPHSASVYSGYQTQNEQIVRMATVESVREVTIATRETGTGTMAGAALGGLAAGSNVGNGNGSAAAAIVGAVAGGIIGHNIEANANNRKGIEITVRLSNGELRAITQEADEIFRPGDQVRLLSSGRTTRVTH